MADHIATMFANVFFYVPMGAVLQFPSDIFYFERKHLRCSNQPKPQINKAGNQPDSNANVKWEEELQTNKAGNQYGSNRLIELDANKRQCLVDIIIMKWFPMGQPLSRIITSERSERSSY